MSETEYVCEKCGKVFYTDYRKYPDKGSIPRFCSRSCANSREKTEEQKEKISIILKNSEKAKESNRLQKIIRNSPEWKESHSSNNLYRVCPVCGKEFETKTYRNKIYCSDDCRKIDSGGLRENSGRSKNGYYKGIYCNSTYELCWVIYNLDNNIPFKRSKKEIPYYYQEKWHKYFPDFELENGELIEIKGYHTELVDIKTEAAISNGYKISVLYLDDLKDVFNYVSETYHTHEYESLYDESKYTYTYTCSVCGKEFSTTRKIDSDTKICSRSCSALNARKYLNK